MVRRRSGFLAMGSALAALAALAGEIPDRLQSVQDPAGRPAWISETELKAEIEARNRPIGSRLALVNHLIDEGGLSRLIDQYSTVQRDDYSTVQREVEIGPDGEIESCDPWRYSLYQGAQATNVGELVKLSKAIVSVRVVESEPGFLTIFPGELIELKVLSIVKDAVGLPAGDFYIFDHFARMVIDGRPLCLGSRQVPRGDFLLFLANPSGGDYGEGVHTALFPLPMFGLDGNALVAADGSFYGTLLNENDADSQEEIADQLADISRLLFDEGKP